MAIGSLLENSFEGTLSSITNVLSVWKGQFSVFCKFLSDEVETAFWENEEKHSKVETEKVRQSVQNYLNQNLVKEAS